MKTVGLSDLFRAPHGVQSPPCLSSPSSCQPWHQLIDKSNVDDADRPIVWENFTCIHLKIEEQTEWFHADTATGNHESTVQLGQSIFPLGLNARPALLRP